MDSFINKKLKAYLKRHHQFQTAVDMWQMAMVILKSFRFYDHSHRHKDLQIVVNNFGVDATHYQLFRVF